MSSYHATEVDLLYDQDGDALPVLAPGITTQRDVNNAVEKIQQAKLIIELNLRMAKELKALAACCEKEAADIEAVFNTWFASECRTKVEFPKWYPDIMEQETTNEEFWHEYLDSILKRVLRIVK
jgi:hypothetical protein